MKTSFGKWDIRYDPVNGVATTGTTSGYTFPGMGLSAVTGELAQKPLSWVLRS